MSCLADSNLTAIREGRLRGLLVWWWWWRCGDVMGGCNGGVGVIYAPLHTETSLSVYVCWCVSTLVCVCLYYFILLHSILS